MRFAIIAGLLGLAGLTQPAWALDKVTFGTNWLADPEAGGYYQALVDGTYEKYGLDVTILQGGPTSNGGMLLIAGKIEFFMGGDMIGDFLAVQNNIPTITVAADFRKNPQCFMSHPGVGLDKWQDLPNANPVFVSAGAVNTFWAWMRLAYGFKDENIKPYNFNSAQFIVDTNSIQEGYVSRSPSRSKSRAASSRTSSCWRTMATPPIRPRLSPVVKSWRRTPILFNGIVMLAKNSGSLEGSSATLELSKPLIFLSAADDRFARLTSKSRNRDNALWTQYED